ncbi:MAG: S8 family serine peptidase [Bdellovibrionales bacterium]
MRALSRKTFYLTLYLCLSACGYNSDKNKQKEATPECVGSQISGEYLVQWKSGEVEVVRFTEEKIDQFIDENEKQILFLEPHYRISQAPSQTYLAHPPLNNPVYFSNLGKGVRVGVVDAGVDTSHALLQNALEKNFVEEQGVTGVDDDRNGYIDDVWGWNFVNGTPEMNDEKGHGTHVSGTIAGSPSGEFSGIASQAKIIAADFMDGEKGTAENAYHAVNYVIARGVHIVNASWTTPFCSKILEGAFIGSSRKNILFVFAAGNSGEDLRIKPVYPASLHLTNKLTVGSVTKDHTVSTFSNYGTPVQIYSPGEQVFSLLPSALSSTGMGYMDGTSMSAAYVSGVAAALKSLRLHLSSSEIMEIILTTAENYDGRVVINYDRALRKILDTP